MDNHYHLIIETIDPTLSSGMRQLNGMYTQWFNTKHQHTGHIFQGRFNSFLIDHNEYLLEVIRYTVLNPVRAKMVQHPFEYKWSSYRSIVGLDFPDDWMACKKVLKLFSEDFLKAKNLFKDFIAEGVNNSSPFDQVEGGVLGSQQFIDVVREKIDPKYSQKEFISAQRLEGRPTLDVIFDKIKIKKDRNMAISIALNLLEYTGNEVGKYLGLSGSTVCNIARNTNSKYQT